MAPPRLEIAFVSDVACPWCAIGLASLDRALERLGSEIDAHLPADAFGRFFSDWRAESLASEDPRAVLCAREASLLSLGLD